MKTRLIWGFALLFPVALALGGPSVRTSVEGCDLFVVDTVPPVVKGTTSVAESILVTLWFKGEPVRSTELVEHGTGTDRVIWHQLAPGPYEIRFEAKGHGTVVKRIVLSPEVTGESHIQSLGDRDELWGAGPSLSDLDKRITALEKGR